ncbi:MAG TPA: tripartite tricarboxylate transporter substrate binding protein [Burkholderiaceae bacterium]|nr:tripartite tricarboxylate transporter substrate binding protein [Burkholderiaceae bacterium]
MGFHRRFQAEPCTVSVPRRRNLKSLALLAAAAIAAPARAQDAYPSRPIRLIVPFAAGGAIDIISRTISAELSKQLDQPIVIDNRPGAGGSIGAEAAARAAPDGYTLVAGTSATHAVNPALYAKLPYDVENDFIAVSYWGGVPNVLVVTPASGIASLDDLIARAKQAPGKLTFGSAGHGTSLHLAGEMFQRAAGVQLTHVPYKGGAPASVDLLAGNITMMFDTVAVSLPNLRAGKTVALAVAAPERHFALPDVPTFAEKGFPSVDSGTWTGLFAPRQTPPGVVQRLEKASAAALAEPETLAKLRASGVQLRPMGSAEFTRFVGAEVRKWGQLVKEAGIKLE